MNEVLEFDEINRRDEDIHRDRYYDEIIASKKKPQIELCPVCGGIKGTYMRMLEKCVCSQKSRSK